MSTFERILLLDSIRLLEEVPTVTSVSRSDIRRRAGLTQNQLARLVGSSAPQICLWERGDRDLPSEVVARIAQILCARLTAEPKFDTPADLARALEHTVPATGQERQRVL